MALNDVYRCTAFGTIFGQDIANVYYYQVVAPLDPTNAAADLAPAWFSSVVGVGCAVQADAVNYTGWLVENIDNLADFSEELSANPGLVAGDCEPAYVAWGFRLRRLTRDSRNGSKRLPGVPTASILNGVAVAGVTAALVEFATAYGQTLTPGGNSYDPIIFRKPDDVFRSGVPFRSDGADYVRVSTQNSRKTTQ